MLIHQARLEGADGSRAMQAAGRYQRQLDLLMEKYKSYLKSAIAVFSDHTNISMIFFKENRDFRWPLECFPMLEKLLFQRK